MKCLLLLTSSLLFLSSAFGQETQDRPRASEDIQVNISFCHQELLQGEREAADLVFGEYQFEVDDSGRPSKIKKVSPDNFGENEVRTCLGQWRLRGQSPGATFRVTWLRDRNEISQVVTGVAYRSTLQAALVRNGTWLEGRTAGSSPAIDPTAQPRLLNNLYKLPRLTMPAALELAQAFVVAQKIDVTKAYLYRSNWSLDDGDAESSWHFTWQSIALRPDDTADIQIKVSQDGMVRRVFNEPCWNGGSRPVAIRLPVPAYPPPALVHRAGGPVFVDVEVDPEGAVVNTVALDGSPLLIPVALKAAEGARFKKAETSGCNRWVRLVYLFQRMSSPNTDPLPKSFADYQIVVLSGF